MSSLASLLSRSRPSPHSHSQSGSKCAEPICHTFELCPLSPKARTGQFSMQTTRKGTATRARASKKASGGGKQSGQLTNLEKGSTPVALHRLHRPETGERGSMCLTVLTSSWGENLIGRAVGKRVPGVAVAQKASS
eukprot:4839044-Pleurochrysis_carterae.AAC.2